VNTDVVKLLSIARADTTTPSKRLPSIGRAAPVKLDVALGESSRALAACSSARDAARLESPLRTITTTASVSIPVFVFVMVDPRQALAPLARLDCQVEHSRLADAFLAGAFDNLRLAESMVP
jgi:hypothetical protein